MTYQLAKLGSELKRDMENALVGNQASSVGGSSTARSSAGLETMIAGNRIVAAGNTTGTTGGADTTSGSTGSTPAGGGEAITLEDVDEALRHANRSFPLRSCFCALSVGSSRPFATGSFPVDPANFFPGSGQIP